ncbi:MAG TPA: hypothetical protein VN132_16535, partial [Bdellovibrio sp.]|nr:hypothetical protein [Bdellovibrio sp.]
MKKSVWIAASFMALVACAEKNIQSSNNSAPTVGKIPFFMSKPQPTNPVQVQFENKYEARKPVNYRKNETLRMSGSATFSPTTLKELAKPVKKLKAAFYIFDL